MVGKAPHLIREVPRNQLGDGSRTACFGPSKGAYVSGNKKAWEGGKGDCLLLFGMREL